jgi:hypothetical protein
MLVLVLELSPAAGSRRESLCWARGLEALPKPVMSEAAICSNWLLGFRTPAAGFLSMPTTEVSGACVGEDN